MKHFPIVAIALFLDGMKGMLGLAFFALGFSTTAAGAVASWIPFAGPLLAGAAAAAGGGIAMVGAAITTCISMVFSGGFMMMLSHSGLLKARQLLSMRRGPFLLGNFIPFINILPLFTVWAVMSIIYKDQADKKALRRGRGAAAGGDADAGAMEGGEAGTDDETDEENELAGAFPSHIEQLRTASATASFASASNDNAESAAAAPARAPRSIIAPLYTEPFYGQKQAA